MDGQLSGRFRALWWAIQLVFLCAFSLIAFCVSVTALAAVVVWVGIPITTDGTRLVRRLADLRRRRVSRVLGRTIGSPYLRPPAGHLLAKFGLTVRDPAFRRDLIWLLVDGTVGLALAIIAVVEAVVDLLFWWLPAGLANRLHSKIDFALLSVSEKSRLALRVEQLTESRAETVDTSAAELRRIERDLHDGAQARLVSIGMSLGMAEEMLERDPEGAMLLLAEARTGASSALSELRDLVRGIHPPVLADRGLVDAVRALADPMPLDVTVDTDVPGRLPAPVESAAYFAVAEVLTNVGKHAGATHASVTMKVVGGELFLNVTDDGRGGADLAKGTGLHGIARRLSAFDGSLSLSSPAGGPTSVDMVVPCASLSPKTSPSSGTA